jgi:putative hydrolase of the HAD superfamily
LPSPDGIHAVLFDLDGTLRHNCPDAIQSFFNKATELGLVDSPERRRAVTRWNFAYWADSEDLKRDILTFGEDESAFWLNYGILQLEAFGCAAGQARDLAPDLFAYMSEEFEPEDVVPEEVPETLARLKDSGYLLGVVSNRNNSFEDYLDEIGLGDYFAFSLAAGQIKSWKPDAEIFHHALRKAESLPQQAVYVGDNYFADVIGARRVGIRPILLDPKDVFFDADCEVIGALDEIFSLL